MGHSPAHAGSVALIFNPKTGLVSPQFHVVFDDDFSTVPSLRNWSMPNNWHQLVCNSREKSTDGFYNVTKTWLTAQHEISAGDTANVSNTAGEGTHAEAAPVPAAVEPTDTRLDHTVPSQAQTLMDDGGPPSIAATTSFDEPAGDSSDAMLDFESSMPPMLNLWAAGLRWSARTAAQEFKPNYKCSMISKCFCTLVAATEVLWDLLTAMCILVLKT